MEACAVRPWLRWAAAALLGLLALAWLSHGALRGFDGECTASCAQGCARAPAGWAAATAAAANGSAADPALLARARAAAAAYRPLPTVSTFPASFWFVKNVKVGGTTLAGVLRNVCARYGVACVNPPGGGSRIGWKTRAEVEAAAGAAFALGFAHAAVVNHGALDLRAAEALRRPLLFTTVRHPVARVLSAYFYNLIGAHRTHAGVPEAEGAACAAALAAGRGCALLDGFRDHYVHGDGTFGANHIFKYVAGGAAAPAEALARYDFVFVTERFDESLVAFVLRHGLALRDAAYLRMKDRSGTYPRAEHVPQDLKDFVVERNALDLELWERGAARLDAEVEALKAAGHDVDGAAAAFAALQAVVAAECGDYEAWYAARGFDTVLTYWGRDNGAAPRCIAHAARLAGHG